MQIPTIKNSEYNKEIPESQTADKPMTLDRRKTNHAKQPDLFHIKMIAKLEWT